LRGDGGASRGLWTSVVELWWLWARLWEI